MILNMYIGLRKLQGKKISTQIRRRRLQFAGHCIRRNNKVVSDLVHWEHTHGTRRREGHQKFTSGIWSAKVIYWLAR